MLLSVDAGIPTAKNSYEDNRRLGSGFYRFTPGVTLIQVIDPASLFLYMGYQTGPAETFGGVGSIEPGDVFRFRLGASLALSPRLRGSIYTAGDIIARTKLNRVRIEHTEGDLIRFGGSLGWDATERVKVEMNSVFGATAEATDAVVTLGITYKIR
jgi:hypothetical protein